MGESPGRRKNVDRARQRIASAVFLYSIENFISLLYSLFACVTLYSGINFTKDQGIHAISYDSICGSSCGVLYLISFRNSMLDISTIYNRQEGRKEGC